MILIATICFNVFLYIVVPKGFFPQQDTGQMFGVIRADQSISFNAMKEKMRTFMLKIKEDPAINQVTGYTGSGQTNNARLFISLKPLSERKVSADEVIGRLRQKTASEPGATLFLQSVQDIRMGGRQSNAQFQYTLQGDNLNELREWTPKAFRALSKLPMLADLNTDQELKGLQTMLTFDRDAMSRLGLTQQQVDDVLYNAFGQRQVSTIYNELNQYKVVMEVAPQYWQNPEALNHIYIQTPNAGPTPSPPSPAGNRPIPRSRSTIRASSPRRPCRSICLPATRSRMRRPPSSRPSPISACRLPSSAASRERPELSRNRSPTSRF